MQIHMYKYNFVQIDGTRLNTKAGHTPPLRHTYKYKYIETNAYACIQIEIQLNKCKYI